MSDLPAPNWYTDPQNPGQVRWWDGSKWSDATRPHPNVSGPSAPAGQAQQPSPHPAQEPAGNYHAPAAAPAIPWPLAAPAATAAPVQTPAAAAQAAAAVPQAVAAAAPAAAVPQAAAAVPQAVSAPQVMGTQQATAVPEAPAAAAQPAPAGWQPVPLGTVAAPPGSNGASSESEPSAPWRGFLQGRLFGVPAWILAAMAVLVVVFIVIIAIPSGTSTSTTSTTSNKSSSSTSATRDAAACQNAVAAVGQQLYGTSLGDVTNQVIANPKTAGTALQKFAAAARAGAQAATADSRVHQQLDNIANDAGYAAVAAQTGFGNLGADLSKLAEDIGTLDTTCGVTPTFAQ